MATQEIEQEIVEDVAIEDTIATAWEEIQAGRLPDEPAVEDKPTDDKPAEVEDKGKPRDDKGKFAKKVEADKPVEAAVEQPLAETKKAPSSWRKEAQEEFNKLPPLVQDEVLKREQDMHKGLETYKVYAEQGHAFERALSPYMATINGFGVSPDVAAVELFKADHALRYGNPQQKLGMVHQIFRDYQISPQDFINSLGQVQQVDPNVQALQQQVHQLKSQQSNWETQAQQRETQALENEVSTFSQGKEHWNSVQEHVASLLPQIVQQNPMKSHQEKLQMAYDMAVWANPTTRALEQTKQSAAQREEQAKIAAAAKTTASVNVRAKGVLQPAKATGSIEDTIREAAGQLGMI